MRKLFLKSILLLCALIVGSNVVWADVTIWSEDFTGATKDAAITAPTKSLYSAVTYTCTDGAGSSPGSTIVKDENLATGSSKPELMVGKKGSGTGAKGGKFTVVIPLDNYEGTLTLTYYQNKQTLKVSSPTTGVSGGQSLKPSVEGQQTTTFTGITTDMTSITIEFESTTTNNVRLDDIVLTGNKAGSFAAPSFSPAGGALTAGTTVTLSHATADQIRYTTDGSEPTKTTGNVYTSPISITSPTTLKAIAVEGSTVSSVATAIYTINVAKPSFSKSSGKVDYGSMLTITATAGHTIIYTTDGSTPSYSESNGDIYDSPIEITQAMTVKAIAVDAYENESSVTAANYTILYAGGVEITPSYSFYGKDETFSGTTFDEVSGTQDGITLTYTRNGSNLYANASAMRFYENNTLKIDAPEGKSITRVVFSQGNATEDDMTSTPKGYTSSEKSWIGDASSVTFTRTGSGYLQFTNIQVVLANVVTISSACNDGEGMYYSTYSSSKAFKVPSDLEVSEIKIIDGKLSLSAYSTNDIVPANTGVLIAAMEDGPHTLEIAKGGTSILGSDNMLKPSGDAGITTANMDEENTTFYRLTMHNGTDIGFWWGAEDGAAFGLAANKAYLAVPNSEISLAPMRFWIENEENNATSIENIETSDKAVKFIENGRILIKKSGIVYDALGRVIR